MDTLADYLSRLRRSGSGVVPILRPANPLRASRWTEVLAWYGIPCAPHALVNATDSLPESETEGPASSACLPGSVLALGGGVASIARVYAAITGRPFACLAGATDIAETTSAVGAGPVIVFAIARLLTFETIQRLQQVLPQPWGTLCARDEAALSFAVAKQLIVRDRLVGGDLGCIDALSGTTIRIADGSPVADMQTFDADGTLDPWIDTSWHSLAVVGHGEGSHVNLEVAVCCGAAEEGERDMLGALLDACSSYGPAMTCKRVHRDGIRVVRFGNLRAQSIALFSCIGFSTAAEVYPSDNSLVLDAAEGYPANVITTDRVLPLSPSLAVLWLGLIGQGHSFTDMIRWLNEITLRQYGCLAYLRFGDPGCDRDEPNHPIPPPPASSLSHLGTHLSDAASLDVYRVADPDRTALILPGRKQVVIVTHAQAPELQPALETVSAQFEAVRNRLEQRAQAVLAAASLQAAIGLAAANGAVPQAGISGPLQELASTRAAVESVLSEAMLAWDQSKVTGLWTDELDLALKAVSDAASVWDRCLTSLVDSCLFDRPFEEIVALGRRTLDVEELGRCPRCASPLRRERRMAASVHTPLLHRLDCPLCGCREVFLEGSPRIHVDQPAALHPGTTLCLDVRTVPSATNEAPFDGWLLTRAVDRGTGQPFFREHAPFTGLARVEIPIPRDITMELHIVKFMVVSDLSISHLRCRIPATKPMETFD